MKKLSILVVLALITLLSGCGEEASAPKAQPAEPAVKAGNIIKIGYNIPMTGDIPKVGEMSKQSAEMLKADINGAGGHEVGGKKYMKLVMGLILLLLAIALLLGWL